MTNPTDPRTPMDGRHVCERITPHEAPTSPVPTSLDDMPEEVHEYVESCRANARGGVKSGPAGHAIRWLASDRERLIGERDEAVTEQQRILTALCAEDTYTVERVARRAVDLRAGAYRPMPQKLIQYPNGCWVACIAGLTGLDHGDLALLVPAAQTCDTRREYNNAVVRHMRQRGWRIVCLGEDIPKGYAIASGVSPRGVRHAVIVKDGELWHDPHPDGGGVTGVYEYEVCTPVVGNIDPLINDAIQEFRARTEKEGTNGRS